MNKHGISYKNLYKYDYINLYESVNGPSKPKYISYRNKNIDFIKNEYEKFSKTQTKFNFSPKKFISFHKSLLHLKLSINPKYKGKEYICYTDRRTKKKKQIENFKQTYQKIFLTNTEDKTIQNTKLHNHKQLHLITDYKTKSNNKINKEKYMSIPSNTFLPFKKSKYLYALPDIINEKISDFVDETKMIRTVKFINTIKIERKKKNRAFMQLKLEENEIEMNSLKTGLKLMDIYKKCFGDYNKFLINEIKKEQKLLNDYNVYKKSLEDQVNILQKKFNDIIKEVEVVNNFKLIFTAIKNKKKMEDFSHQSKIYIEELKTKLKKQIISPRINKTILTKKKTSISKVEKRKSKSKRFSIGNLSINLPPPNINIIEKHKSPRKSFRKSMSIIAFQNNYNKRFERFNSYQPSTVEKTRKLETIHNNDNLDYDIERNENFIINNILKYIDKYNIINSKIIDFKLQLDKEGNSSDNKIKNKLINNQTSDLIYAKTYNKTLTSKYKILRYQNNDYSLLLSIYRKINRMISSVITFKIKDFNHIIDKFREIYDKNKLYATYKSMINDYKSKKLYLDKELINYIYNALELIEELQCELISKKNEYLNNNLYHDRILEFEYKMDMIKRVNNNKEKRSKEILRKQEIYNKAIEKSNKIIFRTYRKVANNYPFEARNKNNINNKNDENEELLMF